MSAFNHITTAKTPFGQLLKEIVAMEAGQGGISPDALDDALSIQRDMIALEIIRADVAAGGRLKSLIRPDMAEKMVGLQMASMVAPPGRLFENFRDEYLANPAANLSGIVSQAKYMQDENIVPETIPAIGVIYCAPETGLGRNSGPLVSRKGLHGGLLVQTCCRCMLTPDARKEFTPLRIHEADPETLQQAQKMHNTLITSRRGFSYAEGEEIGRLLETGAEWLASEGFKAYATTVSDFIDAPKSPFKAGKLRKGI